LPGDAGGVQGDKRQSGASPVGIGEARGLGEVMSAGHSLRRQNYSFVAITPPVVSISPAMHGMRVVVAVVTAVVLDLATFASISTLITGR
jgi:hypothetical protein